MIRKLALVLVTAALGVGMAATSVNASTPRGAFFDCEDTSATPCVTYDEGAWRVVKSYQPYRAVKIKRPQSAYLKTQGSTRGFKVHTVK